MRDKDIVPLDELRPHHYGVVHHVEAGDEEMARLMSMGVCAGRTVELVQCGDPLILKVFGARVGVSARLARCVMVTGCTAGPCVFEQGGLPLVPGFQEPR